MMKVTTQTIPMSFNWRTLLFLAAVGDLIMLVTTAIVLWDTPALALAAIVLLGLVLLRFRGELAGVVLLGLVFAVIATYTLTAAVSNVIHGEQVIDLVIPSSLAALSLAGLISALALLALMVRRGDPEAGGKAAPLVGQVAVAFFVLMLAAGFIAGHGETQAARTTDLVLQSENMAFSRTELTADAGEVTVYLANHDLFWHTFTIDALNVNLKVPVKAERQLTFTAAPGTYSFYCAVPGHEMLGMRGTLTVRGTGEDR